MSQQRTFKIKSASNATGLFEQASDYTQATPLDGVKVKAILADKEYDAESIRPLAPPQT